MAKQKDSGPDFEKSLSELETLVERLEQGDLPLEEALKQFEKGVELTRACQESLKAAEQKVKMLARGSDEPETFDQDPPTDSGS